MNTYKRHRFPPDIISYAVWLYYRFNLSHRDIEDLLANLVCGRRGIRDRRSVDKLRCARSGRPNAGHLDGQADTAAL